MYELLLKNPSNVLKALILQIEWYNIFSEKKKIWPRRYATRKSKANFCLYLNDK